MYIFLQHFACLSRLYIFMAACKTLRLVCILFSLLVCVFKARHPCHARKHFNDFQSILFFSLFVRRIKYIILIERKPLRSDTLTSFSAQIIIFLRRSVRTSFFFLALNVRTYLQSYNTLPTLPVRRPLKKP